MLKELIKKLLHKESLSHADIETAMQAILTEKNETQIAAFLSLLRAKGETAEEIHLITKKMLSMMITVDTHAQTMDIVGTGGDGLNTINISTASALLAASCGVNIAKHGNRSVSSMSGSADVLESLGMQIDLAPSAITQCIHSYNFGFLYAPNFHPALQKLKSIRKKLGIPTVFNLVAPLLNPAQASHLMIGIADPSYLALIADVLLRLEVKHALVFHGSKLDEISSAGPIDMIEINESKTMPYTFDPAEYGFRYCNISSLQGGTAATNAEHIKYALMGNPGPITDTLILNAGLANYIYGRCDTKKEGIALAKDAHAKGAAYQLLESLIQQTTSMPKFLEMSDA